MTCFLIVVKIVWSPICLVKLLLTSCYPAGPGFLQSLGDFVKLSWEFWARELWGLMVWGSKS